MTSSLLTRKQPEELREQGQTDFARSFDGLGGRFRFNVYRQRGLPAFAIRVIPSMIRGFEELGLPPSLKQLARCANGLVLVVGPAGSGKSTTLAAMVDSIICEVPKHVITIDMDGGEGALPERSVGRATHPAGRREWLPDASPGR